MSNDHNTETLSSIGFMRLKEILKIFPIGLTTWLHGVKSGKYPKPIKLSERVNVWRIEDIKALIESYNNDNES